MTLTQEQIPSYVKAGEISKQVEAYIRKETSPGMLLIDLANKIDAKIGELGAEPAFPVNLSLNEIAAHYTPSSKDETIATGLLKVDLGIAIDGFISDRAFSIDLTEDGEFKEMIEINEQILETTLSELTPNSTVSDVGNNMEKNLQNSGKSKEFTIIKNLSGHSIDQNQIHAGITISNYNNENKTELKGKAIAVEPFLTTGNGLIYEGQTGEIYMLQNETQQVRDADARKLLKYIKEKYKTRPFCKRWIESVAEDQGFKKINFALRQMSNQKILHNFPVLIEKTKKPVSQAERTLLILEDKIEITN